MGQPVPRATPLTVRQTIAPSGFDRCLLNTIRHYGEASG